MKMKFSKKKQSFTDEQTRWQAVLRRRHWRLLGAQPAHASVGLSRPGVSHRPARRARPSSGIHLSVDALPVVEMGAAERTLASRHHRLLRLLHRLGGRAERGRPHRRVRQLAGHLLRVRLARSRLDCSLVRLRVRVAVAARDN